MDNIARVYELANLINKAHEAYKKVNEEYENKELVYELPDVTYQNMCDADRAVEAARHSFYKAVRDTFKYFGFILKRGDRVGYYVFEFNELMRHEYGKYRNELDWDAVNAIKTVEQMSEYTTRIKR